MSEVIFIKDVPYKYWPQKSILCKALLVNHYITVRILKRHSVPRMDSIASKTTLKLRYIL